LASNPAIAAAHAPWSSAWRAPLVLSDDDHDDDDDHHHDNDEGDDHDDDDALSLGCCHSGRAGKGQAAQVAVAAAQ